VHGLQLSISIAGSTQAPDTVFFIPEKFGPPLASSWGGPLCTALLSTATSVSSRREEDVERFDVDLVLGVHDLDDLLVHPLFHLAEDAPFLVKGPGSVYYASTSHYLRTINRMLAHFKLLRMSRAMMSR